MKRNRLILLAALSTGACTPNPSVRYMVAGVGTSPDATADLIDTFYLQKSRVRIEWKNTAPQDKPAKYDLAVTVTRAEDTTRRLMVLRDDDLWSRTRINLAKVENSDLVDTAGVEVEDRRIEFLQTAGAIIKTIVPVAMGVSGGAAVIANCPAFPAQACEIVPSEAMLTAVGQDPPRLLIPDEKSGEFTQSNLKLNWGSVPVTAIATNTFVNGLDGSGRNGLYYSACREMVVTYTVPPTNPAQAGATKTEIVWRGKVADPRWVEFVAFPRKGSIRMHSQCGASTTSEKDPTQSYEAVVSAAVTQALAIKDAIEKAEEQRESE